MFRIITTVADNPVQYVEMGNGEEVAVPMCAYCEQVVCNEHSFIDESGLRCCLNPVCKGEIPWAPFQPDKE